METEFATTDPEAAHHYMCEQYVGHRPLLKGSREQFRFSARSVEAGPLRMDHVRHTMSVECEADPFDDLTSVLVRRGRFLVVHGLDQANMSRGDVCLYPSGANLRTAWTDVDITLFRLPMAMGARVAHEITGIQEPSFRVNSLRPLTPELGAYWRKLVDLVGDQMSVPGSAMSNPIIAADTAAMMARAMLRVFATTALGAEVAEPARVTPAAVRRAVAHIDSHAGQPLTVSEIAEASGVGARALQIAFARHHGISPMGYVRRVRLEGAHRELEASSPEDGVTVAAVARRWGFDTPSHFTSIYRKVFGKLPGQTLREG